MDDLKQAWRWIVYFPWGMFLGSVATGAIIYGGNWLVGKYAIPSAVTLFVAACLLPTVAVMAGHATAPPSREGGQVQAVRWVMLSPFIVCCLFLGYTVLTGNFDVRGPDNEDFPSLSEYAKTLLFSAGLLVGTFANVVVDVGKKMEESW
ncbi:hypothetical protein [Pseudoxanthomonas mexicana]